MITRLRIRAGLDHREKKQKKALAELKQHTKYGLELNTVLHYCVLPMPSILIIPAFRVPLPRVGVLLCGALLAMPILVYSYIWLSL